MGPVITNSPSVIACTRPSTASGAPAQVDRRHVGLAAECELHRLAHAGVDHRRHRGRGRGSARSRRRPVPASGSRPRPSSRPARRPSRSCRSDRSTAPARRDWRGRAPWRAATDSASGGAWNTYSSRRSHAIFSMCVQTASRVLRGRRGARRRRRSPTLRCNGVSACGNDGSSVAASTVPSASMRRANARMSPDGPSSGAWRITDAMQRLPAPGHHGLDGAVERADRMPPASLPASYMSTCG